MTESLCPNLHYLFHVDYFAPMTDEHFKVCNRALVESELPPTAPEDGLSNCVIHLQTIYPGLLVGLGALHQSGQGEGEIKLGFTFDYVTGLPVIPGSTVKGILRSAFTRYPESKDGLGYIAELTGLSQDEVNKLETTIFDSGDVFFDAVIATAPTDKHFLALDNITPHLDPLKNPIPLTMLKVRPGVTFAFRFRLDKQEIPGSAMTREALFRRILLDLGAGAKTNTGFGGLREAVGVPVAGVCQSCGGATKKNGKTGVYHPLCTPCREEKERKERKNA
jgi:CRISPR-associated protein Cmr6